MSVKAKKCFHLCKARMKFKKENLKKDEDEEKRQQAK